MRRSGCDRMRHSVQGSRAAALRPHHTRTEFGGVRPNTAVGWHEGRSAANARNYEESFQSNSGVPMWLCGAPHTHQCAARHKR